jgi:hypothetical protein
MKLDIVGQSYESRSKVIDLQDCINFYPEVQQPNSKNVVALMPTPGLRAFSAVTSEGECRGLYAASNGNLYTVCYNGLYHIKENGSRKHIGTLYTTSGTVTFADNGIEMVIADGSIGYLLRFDDNSFSVITSAGYPGGSHVIFTSGFFIVNKPGTGQFYYSDSYDGSTWNAANYFTAEGSPDELLAITKTNNEIWLVGSASSEVWYLTGEDPYTFQRIHGGFNDIGTAARYSVATNGSNVFWLGANAQGDGIVWMASGYQPARISTHGIEFLISKLSRIDDAIGYCYQQEGHAFYVLNFVSAGKTFCYDMTTGLWHERAFWVSAAGEYRAHRGVYHALFGGKNIIGDARAGSLYVYDLDYYFDFGNKIRRQRTSPHYSSENRYLTYNSVEIECERGVGLTAVAEITYSGSIVVEPGVNPLIMLQWSDDGGYTWSNEHHVSAGEIGKYRTRARFNRLGTARDRVFRIAMSDPVKWVVLNAYAEVEQNGY